MPNLKSEEVSQHINALADPHREIVVLLHEIFLNADPEIAAHIKWNSPGFYYNGQMKAFDAKQYKRDLAVVNLHRGNILIVFPTGNKINKEIGLQGKDYPDGRKIIPIESLEDAQNKASLLTKGIQDWLDQIEK